MLRNQQVSEQGCGERGLIWGLISPSPFADVTNLPFL